MKNLVLLDMDGVLVNFTQGFIDTHQWAIEHDDVDQWDFWEKFGMTEAEAWGPTKCGSWWGKLAAYPWASRLVERIEKVADVVFCTSPNLDPTCASQKVQWLIDNKLMHPKKNNYSIGKLKHLMAKSGGILIDDSPANVEKFRAEGGTAILFPQPYNDNRLITENKDDYVMQELSKHISRHN